MIVDQNTVIDFKKYLINQEKSLLTIQKYIHAIEKFFQYTNSYEITKKNLILYRDKLRNIFKPVTVNSYLAAINSFLHFLSLDHLKIQYLKIQKQHFTDEAKEISRKEYKRLLYTARKKDERLYHILLTLGNTGIRVSELQYITAEAVSQGKAEINLKGKCRTIIISGKLRKILKDYMRKKGIEKGSIFITRSGKPVDRSNIWQAMKNLAEDAKVNVKKIFPHNLRHLFARCFYAIEKNLAELADVLGHSSIETTRIYVRTTVKHQKRIFKQMRPNL